jgi:hypothetical protein
MELKTCPSCTQQKQLTDFYKNSGKCKLCQHAYNKNHNVKNKVKYSKYSKKANKKANDRGQQFINRHKSLVGCLKCSDKRYWLIDYHHLDPKEKDKPVPYYKNRTLDILKIEIRKCITLCRNCHTDFHHQEKTKGMKIEDYLTWTPERNYVSSVLENYEDAKTTNI